MDVPKMIIFCQSKEAAVKIYRFLSGSAYHKDSVSMFHASLTQNVTPNYLSVFLAASKRNRADSDTSSMCVAVTLAPL